ncbi:hypothetical protein [Roseateles koreensis]|uniref:Uncharacterized protein n=1 Tax=Roseateles koreensis TaxID=2987526 RepID=A0ABT5KVG1_9BURK|nr:hypothetical protein [Roseateles koreensis]MDC8786932.1 hypothetical protein [Roseateles koreensis]
MQAAARHQPQASRQFWLALLCAFCLLGAQGLGLWHRVAHAAVLSLDAAERVDELAGDKSLTPKGMAPQANLWGHQAGDAFCQLFDHMVHDHMPGADAVVTPPSSAVLAHAMPAYINASPAVFWKRGARGPPLSV